MVRRLSSLTLVVLMGLLAGGLSACDVLDPFVLGGGADPDAGGDGGATAGGGKLYTTMDLTGEAIETAARVNLRQVPIIYQSYIDPGNHGALDADRLRKRIAAKVPANYTGPALLNWEGVWLDRLKELGTANHTKSVVEGVKALQVARATRPQAQWGIYALPFRRYWDRENPEWDAWAEGMAPILDAADFIAPSIYDFYEDERDPKGRQWDRAYVQANVRHALQHARGKPVYPVIWHRWHNSNARRGGEVVPDDEWAAHADAALTAEWNGRRPAGVIWWGGDDHAARTGNIVDVDRIPTGLTPQKYVDRLLAHKAAVLAEAAGGQPAQATSPGDPYLGPNPNRKK